MIGKLIKGKGARGLAEYLLGPQDMNGDKRPRVAVIGGTMAGRTPRELAAELGELRRLRPGLGVAVAHMSMRLPEGDPVPGDATFAAIADAWAREMGFQHYVTVSHGDHVHIMSSRINADGSVVSDAHDWKRSEAAIRAIEEQFGLTKVEPSHLLEPERATTHRKAPNRGQIAMTERGEVPPSAIVAELIDQQLAKGCTVSQLVDALEGAGVVVKPNVSSTGRVAGLAYELDGTEVSAKAMGRGFTWANMIKKGLVYVEDRDLPRLRRAIGEGAGDGIGAGVESTQGSPSGTGGVSARSAGDTGADRRAPDARSGGHGNPDPIHSAGVASGSSRTESSGRSSRGHRPNNEPLGSADPAPVGRSPDERRRGDQGRPEGMGTDGSSSSHGRRGRSSDGNDLERLVVLAVAAADAATTDRTSSPRGEVADRRADASLDRLRARAAAAVDRTREAVEQWLKALPADTYRLQLVRPGQANVNVTSLSADELRKRVAWLKAENARGVDVYARPEDRRYILVDDVTPATLDRMRADGFEPAAVLETSRGNFAAWLCIAGADAPEPTPQEATAAAKGIAARYGADPAAADHAHVSRLPGFTNRKPSRQIDGRSPFVLLREATGTVARAGAALMGQVRAWIAQKARTAAVKAAPVSPPSPTRRGDPVAAYQALAKRQAEAMGDNPDWSRVDFRAAQDMVLQGWSRADVAAAIEASSPGVIDRKGGSVEGYAARTAAAAAESERVQAELRRRAEQRKLEKAQEHRPRSSPRGP